MNGWYLAALPLILALAGAHTAIDWWLLSLPRPLPTRAVVVLAARWGFLAVVLIYAWLIDSRRVGYAEPDVWALFGTGGLLTVALVAVVCRRGRGA